MDQDIIEAECQIAYHQEGERLKRAPFPSYHHLNKPLTSRYRFFKRGGLYFIRFGSFQLSFCKVKPC